MRISHTISIGDEGPIPNTKETKIVLNESERKQLVSDLIDLSPQRINPSTQELLKKLKQG